MEFKRANFPACDMRESVEDKLLSTELTRGIRSCMVGRDVPKGSPRYVNGMVPIVHPKIEAI